MCGIYIMLGLCRESHHIICSTAHICNMHQTVWQNMFIQTLHKIKNKRFSVLAWHGLYEYEVDARQWLQYTQFPHCTIKKSRK